VEGVDELAFLEVKGMQVGGDAKDAAVISYDACGTVSFYP
jgi:hypothetical protein